MCGIAGILNSAGSGEAVQESILHAMCAAIAHRGPDDNGTMIQGTVGLGMRRLSIIDLKTGHQPIDNEDGSLSIVFNGEIYNHADLREQLKARGHRFRTQTDTEAIIHLYEDHGPDCLRYLRGMFAFAIWDKNKRTLFIARDRLGIKPLYYYSSERCFLFASEIKALLTHPAVPLSFCCDVLPEYLAFGYLSGNETFYQGIHKLMPGHWLEVTAQGQIRSERYWDLSLTRTDDKRFSDKEYCRTYRELLENAVSSHMMSEVPLGVFLSGGLDSSVVAALATKVRGSAIQTFSVGYRESSYSELQSARAVSKHLDTRHHEVVMSESDFFDSLPGLIWHEDEPISWPSSVALYFVARLAREHVKVVLSGEGSDETLAGYGRYAFTLRNLEADRIYRHLVPQLCRHWIARSLSTAPWISARNGKRLAHTFLVRDGNSWSSLYCDNFLCAFGEGEQLDLIDEDIVDKFRQGQSYTHALEYWEGASGDVLQRMRYADIKTYLVELLMKQDNMSMAASVESRVPFLDHGLVEYAMQLPEHLLISGSEGKMILKKLAEDLLPKETIYQRKLGFPTPWSYWLSGPRLDSVEKLLLEGRSLDRGLFAPKAVSQLVQEHRSGRRNHDDRIWRLLNLELWHRVCVEGEGQQPTRLESLTLAKG